MKQFLNYVSGERDHGMFIGHAAVAFAAKRVAPKASLGVLMAAPFLLDLLWPIFLLLGWEQVQIDPGNTAFSPLAFTSYPYSHSLAAAVFWSVLFGLGYWAFTRYSRGAVVSGALVFSHWVFDAIVHRPDLPLYPGSNVFVGLDLWNSIPGTLVVEGLLFVVGVWIYIKATRAQDRVGAYAMWGFVGFLVLAYILSIIGGAPPNEGALAWGSLLLWILPFWAGWYDRRRTVGFPLDKAEDK